MVCCCDLPLYLYFLCNNCNTHNTDTPTIATKKTWHNIAHTPGGFWSDNPQFCTPGYLIFFRSFSSRRFSSVRVLICRSSAAIWDLSSLRCWAGETTGGPGGLTAGARRALPSLPFRFNCPIWTVVYVAPQRSRG